MRERNSSLPKRISPALESLGWLLISYSGATNTNLKLDSTLNYVHLVFNFRMTKHMYIGYKLLACDKMLVHTDFFTLMCVCLCVCVSTDLEAFRISHYFKRIKGHKLSHYKLKGEN